MRILQVVGLISPEGEYGGPTRVATEQCAALAARGHDVILAAGSWGFDPVPEQVAGVRVKLFPAHAPGGKGSLRGLASPSLAPWVHRHAPSADIVHVHLGRDFVTMPSAMAALCARAPFVVQTHGMVQPSGKLPVRVLDHVSTLPVLRAARKVFYLTQQERDGLLELEPGLRLAMLRNGIRADAPPRELPAQPREVLFLARVQERKRPLDFVAAARLLAPEFPGVTFRLIGPDEGQGDAVRAAIAESGLGDRLVWDGPIAPDATRAALEQADVYVLPSVDEPYPMSVIEALAVGVPTVITTSCGLADLVSSGGAGAVVEPGAGNVAAAVRQLLADPAARAAAARGACETARGKLDIERVAAELEQVYTSIR